MYNRHCSAVVKGIQAESNADFLAQVRSQRAGIVFSNFGCFGKIFLADKFRPVTVSNSFFVFFHVVATNPSELIGY